MQTENIAYVIKESGRISTTSPSQVPVLTDPASSRNKGLADALGFTLFCSADNINTS
ncbi:MAG: hypothetical protein NVS3B3_21040 [Aquirhabdus sp.]